MKKKAWQFLMVLLLGAQVMILSACGKDRIVFVEVPEMTPTPVGEGVYSFQPEVSETPTAFVSVAVRIRGLQRSFTVAPRLDFDPDGMGFDSYTMNAVQSNIYTYSFGSVATHNTVAMNMWDSDYGGYIFNEQGLNPGYPDQLVTVSVSVDGGPWTPVSMIQGNDLVFEIDEFGNLVVPRFDLTIVYRPDPSLPVVVPPDLYFAWYFDPAVAETPFPMVEQPNGDWQVVLLNVPIGIYESNLHARSGPFDVAVSQDGVAGTFTFNDTPITSVVWYATIGFDPLFPDLSLVQMANLLLRVTQTGTIQEVGGGTVIYLDAP